MATSGDPEFGGLNSVVLDERALLRTIDLAILQFNEDTQVEVVEHLFLDSVAQLCRVHDLPGPGSFLVYTETEFRPLAHAGEKSALPTVRRTPTLWRFINRETLSTLLVEFGEDQAFFESIGSAGACLAAPIYTGLHLLCVMVVAADSPEHLERLRDPQLRQAVDDLAAQLTIAYRQFERARHHFEMNGLWNAFLEHNLSPTVCFDTLAERIKEFLPTFGPIGAVDRKPATQILMLQKPGEEPPHKEHLVIRGTTGEEHNGTKIDIADSITGYLLTRPKLEYFYGDPTAPAYAGTYKNYFQSERAPARTEFAFRMMDGDTCIGIVNLESRHKDAFSLLQRQTLLGLADTFGRLAMVLEKRLTMNTEMQHSVATSTRNYLEALARTYGHAIQTPLHSQSQNAELLGNQIGDVEKWSAKPVGAASGRASGPGSENIEQIIGSLQQTHARIGQIHEEISSYSMDFIEDISGYAVEARLVLRDVMESAIRLADHCLLRGEADQIRIEVVSDTSLPTTHIYCSTLIKQHLYSVFHNAVEATFERMKADGRPGRIAVSIAKEEIPEGQERELNKAWVVRIRDNGGGVDEAKLAELNKFEPGITFKKGGSGYGLVAAQRYVLSISGRIKLDSVEGEYFEVAIHFEEDMTEPEDQPPRGSEDGADG